ncbi:lacr bacterial regulatory protein hth signature [Lucifera butyrica]|uniref:Lacr bacterial regulatory protein hth signature n=1 Tax=Lucifera butyrica TaxID=1351585 RepID=A0A498RBN1_9FIRM|nr:DeoR/GlpR family DNA-binding transcription regulator [Lucifera butyrica]VBB07543.1 lacr bacterial regulatory protein hth signature [Lucifera butyrica]
MFAEERKNQIQQMVKSGTPVKVNELSLLFQVSESTIRRDLQELEDTGLLQRTHGGAISLKPSFELSFQEKEVRQLEEKRKIAQAAARLVEEGESILLDAGTTTLEIARLLQGKDITVATNSMDVAQIFLDDNRVEVLLLGGTWRKTTRSLVGYVTNETLQRVHFHKVFLAANAVDLSFGVTTPNLNEAETKRHMIKAADQVILVVDHTKFGQKDLSRICRLDEVDLILTDDGLDENRFRQWSNQVKIMVAK